MSGADLSSINGISTNTALKIIAEIGTDMNRWKTVKHFTSWLGLCPGSKISGGKVLSSATKPVANRAAAALRMAELTLLQFKERVRCIFETTTVTARSAQSHYCNCAQIGQTDIQHAQAWHCVC
jgi:transposase